MPNRVEPFRTCYEMEPGKGANAVVLVRDGDGWRELDEVIAVFDSSGEGMPKHGIGLALMREPGLPGACRTGDVIWDFREKYQR